jgi:hypothetical protein
VNLMNETEREQLSAYLDSRLSTQEATELERRLASDPALRLELDTLRETQMLVRGLPTLRAPRSLALTSAMVRSRSRPLYLSTWVSLASAAAAVVLMALGLFSSMTANAPSPLANQAPPAVAVMPTDSANLSVQATSMALMPNGTQAPLLTQTRVDEAQAEQDPAANAGLAAQTTPAEEARTVVGTQTLEAVMAAPAAADSAAGAAASGMAESSPTLITDALDTSGETEAAAEMQFAATIPAQPTLAPTLTPPPSPTLTATVRLSATPQPTAQVAQLPTDMDDNFPQDGALAQRQTAPANPSLLLIGAGIVLLLVALVTTLLRMCRR